MEKRYLAYSLALVTVFVVCADSIPSRGFKTDVVKHSLQIRRQGMHAILRNYADLSVAELILHFLSHFQLTVVESKQKGNNFGESHIQSNDQSHRKLQPHYAREVTVI